MAQEGEQGAAEEPKSESATEPIDAGPAANAQAQPMTEQELAEAKQYAREDLICDLIDKAVDIAYLAIFAFLFARPLDPWIQTSLGIDNLWGRLAVMYLILTGLHFCVSFPLSFYSGHILEHKFKMSRQTFGQWLWRYSKGVALTLVFGLAMAEGLYLVIWLTGSYWWLAAAVVFFLVSVVLGQLAPVLIFPLFYKIERFEDAELGDRMSRLAEGTGLSIEGVYRMKLSEETVKANAMLAGMGRTRRVIMGDTLLDGFSHDEIEVVFAHEIGHHVHRHIRSMLLIGVVLSLSGFLLCHWSISTWDASDWTHRDKLPVYVLPMLTLVTSVFFLLLAPLQNAISRHFERQCDRYALQRTGNAPAYRSAFTKLAKMNKDDPDPHPLEVFWLHSHPPISERLAMADQGT